LAGWVAVAVGDAGLGFAAMVCAAATDPQPAVTAASNAIPAADRVMVKNIGLVPHTGCLRIGGRRAYTSDTSSGPSGFDAKQPLPET